MPTCLSTLRIRKAAAGRDSSQKVLNIVARRVRR